MYLDATALTCPLGFSTAAACSAKRAGIAALEDLGFKDDTGEPIVGGTVPGLEPAGGRTARLIQLLTKTVAGLVAARPGEDWSKVPLLVGLAEKGRPGGGGDLAESIVDQVQAAVNVRFHPELSGAIPVGHTAALEALKRVRRLFQESRVAACLVCAVDSYLNPATLQWLDDAYRLKTTANADGLIPGEAAAAVLVRAEAGNAATEVAGLGFGEEPAPIRSDEPLRAAGLAQAVKAALSEARLGYHEIDFRLSDVTGESYGFKEVLLMEARVMRELRYTYQPIWHWSEAIGDTGAAAGLVQLVVADDAFRKGYAPGRSAICLSSSGAGARAAAVVRPVGR